VSAWSGASCWWTGSASNLTSSRTRHSCSFLRMRRIRSLTTLQPRVCSPFLALACLLAALTNCRLTVHNLVVCTVTEDLRGMLEDHCNLDQFVTWMRLVADELVEQGALPAPEKLSESIYRAQTFLFCWAQYTSLIMCDLTCRDAPSLGTLSLVPPLSFVLQGAKRIQS
jgi:hypothetical protein